MKTLLLNPSTWDLLADASGNIAVASEPYSLAQDAASAIKLFEGELYFNTILGTPYFSQILGHSPPISLMKAYFVNAARSVPGVISAQCFISGMADRIIQGQVQVTDAAGNVSAAGF